jgi:hypothetical protein
MSGTNPRTRKLEEFDARGIGWVRSKDCEEVENDLDYITNELVESKCQVARNQESIASLHKRIEELEAKVARYEQAHKKSKRIQQDDAERPERNRTSEMLGYNVDQLRRDGAIPVGEEMYSLLRTILEDMTSPLPTGASPLLGAIPRATPSDS